METREIILIDIESILDLRQGFLRTKYDSFRDLTAYMLSDEYAERDSDKLLRSEQGEYGRAILTGDKTLIKDSAVSYIGYPLSNTIASVFHKGSIEGGTVLPTIYVNIFPFVLNEDECDLLRDGVFRIITDKCHIEIVNIDPKDITITFIKESNIGTMFLYNWRHWLNLHSEPLSRNPIPKVKLYGPRLYEKEPDDDKYEEMKKKGFDDPFTIFEMMYLSFIGLHFLPICFYNNSLVSHDVIKKYNQMIKNIRSEVSEEELEAIKKMEEELNGDSSK